MPYGNPTRPPSPVRSGEQLQSSPTQPSAFWVGVVARFGGRRRLDGPRYKLFWQTMAIAASMLLFAALRPPTTEVTAGDTTQLTRRDPSSRDPSANELRRPTSGTPSQQAEVVAEARPRKSDHVVARDLHTHNIAAMQKSELARSTQGSLVQKRVVLD